ncbi:MAG: GTPase ObgE [Deltaproteobacteria bacterium]|nr:GTPase ObgE [Deltaproteobacteria bacterium]
MKFVDEAQIEVRGGHGGAGCVSFLRETYKAKGGPNGGNGGDGGDVVLVADPSLTSLLDFKYQPRLLGERGEHGRGKDQHGHRGADAVARVPLGTLVRDAESGDLLADLTTIGERVVIARGGRGGRGNAYFKTSTNQAPRKAQPGLDGEERRIRLELQLVADVGLLGFPNVGKSTFISRVSAARPRIADYPFTTLVPNLGVVRVDEDTTFVLADIPGLIEGAHEGHGLGHRFLRHVSRTSLLLHLLDASAMSGRDPLDDYDVINRELALYDPAVAAKPQVVAANKSDAAPPGFIDELTQRFAARGIELHAVSAVSGDGVAALIRLLGDRVRESRATLVADESENQSETTDEHG